MLLSELQGRDVAILGVGREGLAARLRFRERFPNQPLTLYSEVRPAAELTADFTELDMLRVGPLESANLDRHEVIIRSPGFSPYRSPLRRALEAGVTFTSGTNLWLAAHPEARTLCITGTKGKSTTTAMLHHLLSAAGARSAVAGNIGVPLISCNASDADWWVVELSSYQLCDLASPPWLAVVLNLSDEHLDWHGTAERYHRDKLRLAELAPAGRLVANASQPVLVEALRTRTDTHWFNQSGGLQVKEEALWEGGERLPGLRHARGSHNLENLAAALTVCTLLDLRPEPLEPVLDGFRGLPHRQTVLGERGGLRFVDDSLSTTPVATLAALDALQGRPVTVLVGGLDRGIDWGAHAAGLEHTGAHAFVGLPDSGSAVISLLERAGIRPPGGLHCAGTMKEAVALAQRITPSGGTVLLSPGAPSFPIYRDYRERARVFAEAAGFDGQVGKK